jgi:hypothetical protein
MKSSLLTLLPILLTVLERDPEIHTFITRDHLVQMEARFHEPYRGKRLVSTTPPFRRRGPKTRALNRVRLLDPSAPRSVSPAVFTTSQVLVILGVAILGSVISFRAGRSGDPEAAYVPAPLTAYEGVEHQPSFPPDWPRPTSCSG